MYSTVVEAVYSIILYIRIVEDCIIICPIRKFIYIIIFWQYCQIESIPCMCSIIHMKGKFNQENNLVSTSCHYMGCFVVYCNSVESLECV